ncbi:Replication factor C large subunit [Trichinella spiralis]|uniref:Replication factor C large subunit n=1 Tax=Trichinella spiralis TaxID=6334 RepID=A0ABR3L0U5_TRISP
MEKQKSTDNLFSKFGCALRLNDKEQESVLDQLLLTVKRAENPTHSLRGSHFTTVHQQSNCRNNFIQNQDKPTTSFDGQAVLRFPLAHRHVQGVAAAARFVKHTSGSSKRLHHDHIHGNSGRGGQRQSVDSLARDAQQRAGHQANGHHPALREGVVPSCTNAHRIGQGRSILR